ncbi:hypothetical protein HY224_02625 [Candidatus Uhrbacteria bacterium]|nr:hypothetical protein [Candidatus Uhrbacteria bacterium]
MEIDAGNSALPLTGENKIILHLIPMESFSTKLSLPTQKIMELLRDVKNLHPMTSANLFAPQINLAGGVSYTGRVRDKARSYIQVFRNGVIESVESSILDKRDSGYIPHVLLEKEVVEATKMSLNAFRLLEIEPPFFIFLSLMNVAGLTMPSPDGFGDAGEPIRQQNLHLPEVTIESFEQSVPSAVKPVFDLIWNACGLPGSLNFNAAGEWLPKV